MRPSEKQITRTTRDRLDLYNYDGRIARIWVLIKEQLPEYQQLYEKYENLLIMQAKSKAARENNLKIILSLGRIIKSKGYKWQTLTKDEVTDVVAHVMKTWADADGRETWHTVEHKKFLKLFFRWLKTGKREYDRRYPEPDEIIDVIIKKVPKKLTREDLLTKDEHKEILQACGDNLRDRGFVSLVDEAGPRAGESLNVRIGDIELNKADKAIELATGKTDWTSSSDNWEVAIETSNYIAAASILDGIPGRDEQDKSKDYGVKIRDNFKRLNQTGPAQNKSAFVAKGINITDMLEEENYTQDATDTGSGIF